MNGLASSSAALIKLPWGKKRDKKLLRRSNDFTSTVRAVRTAWPRQFNQQLAWEALPNARDTGRDEPSRVGK